MRAGGIGLQFLTGGLQGSHDPGGVNLIVLAAISGMEREYIRTGRSGTRPVPFLSKVKSSMPPVASVSVGRYRSFRGCLTASL